MINAGAMVALRRSEVSKYPAKVMVQSATTLARVPASVDNKPLLYVPFASRTDMTLDNNDKFTPIYIHTQRKLYLKTTYSVSCTFDPRDAHITCLLEFQLPQM